MINKFTYSPLGKTFKKQTKKQIDALESLKISNEINKLRAYFHKIS